MLQAPLPQAEAFNFLLGDWDVVNKILTPEGTWAESEATLHCEAYLGGRVIIDHYDGTVLGGRRVRGITIRAFDPDSQRWSIVWLDDKQAPDLTPLIGRFEAGVGEFFQEIPMNGTLTRVRFTWDQISDSFARWNQAFSSDDGRTWRMNWIMEFTRRGRQP